MCVCVCVPKLDAVFNFTWADHKFRDVSDVIFLLPFLNLTEMNTDVSLNTSSRHKHRHTHTLTPEEQVPITGQA